MQKHSILLIISVVFICSSFFGCTGIDSKNNIKPNPLSVNDNEAKREVIDRGRTFDQLINPKKYKAFSGVSNKTGFNDAWENNRHWILAKMSHAAYFDENYLKNQLGEFGAKIKFYKSPPNEHGVVKGRQAFMAIWEDKAILSFRGTESNETLKINMDENVISFFKKYLGINLPKRVNTFLVTDIKDDSEFFQVHFSGSKVHQGFLKATEELWPDISKDLEELENHQLFATGHSLGGAMAVIAGMHHSFKEIVTFGEPRVGKNIANGFKSNTHIRYVNGNDRVTKIVPKKLYEHHGIPIEINDIKRKNFIGSNSFIDHSIINYAEILAERETVLKEMFREQLNVPKPYNGQLGKLQNITRDRLVEFLKDNPNSTDELFSLFSSAYVPKVNELDGEYKAELLDTGILSKIFSHYINTWFGPANTTWKGKAFGGIDKKKQYGYNLFESEDGTEQREIQFQTFVGKTRFIKIDKRESFHLKYKTYNKGLNKGVYDEIRKINDQLYLGIGTASWGVGTANPGFFILYGEPLSLKGIDEEI